MFGSAETQCNKSQEYTSAMSLFASSLLYNNVVNYKKRHMFAEIYRAEAVLKFVLKAFKCAI